MLAFGDQPSQGNGWKKVSGVMDSGAADHCASKEAAPHVPVRPSPGARKGQHFVAANGDRVANEGEQTLHVMTEEGAETDMAVQITDVKKPLFSVTKLCGRGNRAVFGRGGGVIHNLATNKLTPFRRRGGIYTIDLWVRQGDGAREGGPETQTGPVFSGRVDAVAHRCNNDRGNEHH